jgi:hypothetical protein
MEAREAGEAREAANRRKKQRNLAVRNHQARTGDSPQLQSLTNWSCFLRLLAVLYDALKNKESDARDIARNTMAKTVLDMNLKYLADIMREEVAITLTEA